MISRQSRARRQLDGGNVGAIDGAVSRNVFAEVRAANRVTRLRFCLTKIGRVYGSVAARVADKNGDRDNQIAGISAVVNTGQAHRKSLRVSDAGQING